jgi:methyl-accepting chemotaxis protein
MTVETEYAVPEQAAGSGAPAADRDQPTQADENAGRRIDALEREVAKLNSAIQGAMTPIVFTDSDLIITHANPAAVELFSRNEQTLAEVYPGFSASKLIGTCIDEFHQNPHYQRRILADPKNMPHNAEITVGRMRLNFTVAATFDHQGNHIGHSVELYDVTEKRKAELENQRLKAAVESADSALMISDDQRVIRYANPAARAMFGKRGRELQARYPGFDAERLEGQSIDQFHAHPGHQRDMLRDPSRMPFRGDIEMEGLAFNAKATIIHDGDGNYMGNLVEWRDETDLRQAERQIRELVEAATAGDFGKRVEIETDDAFLCNLADALNTLMEVTEKGLTECSAVMERVARGDLEGRIQGEYSGLFRNLKRDVNATIDTLQRTVEEVAATLERLAGGDLTVAVDKRTDEGVFTDLASAVNSTVDAVRGTIVQIRDSAFRIGDSTAEIAQGNTDLSQRTEEQASSLEETASSMEEMTSTVRSSADNARQADQLAQGAREQAEKGGEIVARAIDAMGAINDSSTKISDIIGVIDEIAFQTNLLALNAAVEAARAGEQGRGFAVVAAEVRNLAQRSAEAAKEIKGLISDSVTKVKDGSQLVDSSGETLGEIVTSVKKVSDVIAEIAAAAGEHSSGIEQVNKAVTQLDDVTQQNAALVEEAAAASKSLDDQARSLRELVSTFRIGDDASIAVQRAAGAPAKGTGEAGHRRVDVGRFGHAHASQRKPAAAVSDGSDDGQWEEF